MDQVPHHHLLFHLTDVETNANFRTAGAVLFPPCGSISWTSWWMEKPQPLIWIGWKLSCGRLKIKNLQMCPNMSPENTWKMSCVTFWLVQIDSWTVACHWAMLKRKKHKMLAVFRQDPFPSNAQRWRPGIKLNLIVHRLFNKTMPPCDIPVKCNIRRVGLFYKRMDRSMHF